jgi:hypothetical protein
MLAVLNDAIECLTKYRDCKSRAQRALYREAREWILSKDTIGLYSFESVCETLQIDPNCLRLGLAHCLLAASPWCPGDRGECFTSF